MIMREKMLENAWKRRCVQMKCVKMKMRENKTDYG